MRTIDEIIIHCSATPEGRNVTVKEIDAWHRKRGFSCIGYHYVVYLDGSVHKGRQLNEIGAHCVGHNRHSIGVCYIGGVDKNLKPKDTRTPAQRRALTTLLRELRKEFPNACLRGHRDFAAKACPSFDATKEYANL